MVSSLLIKHDELELEPIEAKSLENELIIEHIDLQQILVDPEALEGPVIEKEEGEKDPSEQYRTDLRRIDKRAQYPRFYWNYQKGQ